MMILVVFLISCAFSQNYTPTWEFLSNTGYYCLNGGFQSSKNRFFSVCHLDSDLLEGNAYYFNYGSNESISKVEMNSREFIDMDEESNIILTLDKLMDDVIGFSDNDFNEEKQMEVDCPDVGPFVHPKNNKIAISHEDKSTHYFEVLSREDFSQIYSTKEEKKEYTYIDEVHFLGENDFLYTKVYDHFVPRVFKDYTHYQTIVDYTTGEVSYKNELSAFPENACYAGNYIGYHYLPDNTGPHEWYQLNEYKDGKLEKLFEYTWKQKTDSVSLSSIQVDSEGYSYLVFNYKDYPIPDYVNIVKLDKNGDKVWELKKIGKGEYYLADDRSIISEDEKYLGVHFSVGYQESRAYSAAMIFSTDDGSVKFIRQPSGRTYSNIYIENDYVALVGKVGVELEENTEGVIEFFELN